MKWQLQNNLMEERKTVSAPMIFTSLEGEQPDRDKIINAICATACSVEV